MTESEVIDEVDWQPGEFVYWGPGNHVRALLEVIDEHSWDVNRCYTCNWYPDNWMDDSSGEAPVGAMRWNPRIFENGGDYLECNWCDSTTHGLVCPAKTSDQTKSSRQWRPVDIDEWAEDSA